MSVVSASGSLYTWLLLDALELKMREQEGYAEPDSVHRRDAGILPVGCPFPRHPGIELGPSNFHTRPNPRLIGIVVELPWRQLTVQVESADFTYQPRPSVYEISGWNCIWL